MINLEISKTVVFDADAEFYNFLGGDFINASNSSYDYDGHFFTYNELTDDGKIAFLKAMIARFEEELENLKPIASKATKTTKKKSVTVKYNDTNKEESEE